ncbi:MAG TPA: iron ABC transporter permease, partial [Petrotogaceae bacterium]|nr:iron ABC transporter permease [Petrotogaceae bacterium]
MFTKKKVLIFIISLVLFTVVDFWVFSNIKDSFDDIMTQQIRKNVSAAVESVPREEEEIPEWIQTTKNINQELEVFYLKGFEAKEILLGEEMQSFFDVHKLSEDFSKGLESASYEEIYISPKKYDFKGKSYKLIFVPSIDHETAEFLGVGVFLYSSAEQDKFYGLLYILALSSFGIFFLVYYIGRFTRDPVLGYTILILFAVVLIFVAYPLFEAVRLSFIKEGRFSFEIWKNILTSKQYLSALWGSILLGICTATASTAIGFLFAFVLTRTNIKGKKFFSAMATMPVISPPFS